MSFITMPFGWLALTIISSGPLAGLLLRVASSFISRFGLIALKIIYSGLAAYFYIHTRKLKTYNTYNIIFIAGCEHSIIFSNVFCIPCVKTNKGWRMHISDAVSILKCALDCPCFRYTWGPEITPQTELALWVSGAFIGW